MSWEQLGVAVRARRKELGLTQEAIAAAAAISVERLRDIERNRRPGKLWMRVKTGLESALVWESGSVDAVLSGGVATPLQDKHTERGTAEDTDDDGRTLSSGVGDRFSMARQVLSLRATLSAHQSGIDGEARQALLDDLDRAAREAEDVIVQMMPRLEESERGDAIELLVALRQPWSADI
ncbi:helix-turn-helix domain-containing protein [Mycolicibacterium septicum]|uniref:helix-turn-helix domain-containing protein n=1 Tax=Mycolicibacterium septicum TaxID=98668 RepID=UPI0023603B31|nr:helix-turn-helix domain-containing protein [Mycolicibacterium septicum]